MSSIPIALPSIGDEEKRRVRDVLDDGMIADGPVVRSFEEEFATTCEAAFGVATMNGTAALHAALEALGIGEGDTVVTTPFSFVATANAIRFAGARPVFADIDPRTYNLDPDAVEERVRAEDADAILVVHLYGLPAAMDRFVDLAETYDLALLEDAAQAHGATYRGRPVGAIGDAGCFSFYPTKNMTTGEGGMIVTDRDDVADRARKFVNHGRSGTYDHDGIGHNFRMTSIAAAMGRAQLEKLPRFVEQRRANAAALTDALSGSTSIEPPAEPAATRHSYHQYTVRCETRDRLEASLAEASIDTGVYYPRPIHDQPAYAHVDADAPAAESAADAVLSLPVHPGLEDGDVETIATALTEYDDHE